MKKIRLVHLSLLFLFTATTACNELIEEDLSKHKVKITAPVDSTKTHHQTILFSWEEVKYGRNYHVQLAAPSFTDAQTLLVDSIISFPDTIQVKTSFKQKLFPGNFQWRIRSFNGNSTTPFAVAAFTIIDTTTVKSSVGRDE